MKQIKKKSKARTFICEGCGEFGQSVSFPSGWMGFGTSARGEIAAWCRRCVAAKIPEQEARSTQAEAIAVSKRRGLYMSVVQGVAPTRLTRKLSRKRGGEDSSPCAIRN